MAYKKKIRILWVGKTREGYLQAGIDRYTGLLKHHADLQIKTIKEERGCKDRGLAIKKEGERILRAVEGDFILLSERGILLDSLKFAELLDRRERLTFVLGGPFGVDRPVYEGAEMVLSLSPLTFTHEMSRLILLEQLYRAFTIIKGKGYHY